MTQKLRVLLTNDDGFFAPGIKQLFSVLKEVCDVTVVAPDEEQSGIGHAFTYQKPLKIRKDHVKGMSGYVVAGTPADCVKVALGHLLKETPQVIISGLNNDINTGIAGYYSGTVAAAREGAFWKIPSIAFSLSELPSEENKEYSEIAVKILFKVFELCLKNVNHENIYYNVNFPPCSPKMCTGIKVTRQSLSFWDDLYTEKKREDGGIEYWLSGERKDVEDSVAYDTKAIYENYVTITPLHVDATASEHMKQLSGLEKLL